MDSIFFRNIFSLFSIQVVNYILPLMIVPRLLNVLGVELFGVYILTLTAVQYFLIFSEYGFNLTVTRKLAIRINDKGYVSKVFISVVVAKLTIAALGLIVVNVFVLITSHFREYLFYFNISYLAVLGGVFFPIWLYQAYEKMHLIAICNFISRLLGVIFVYLLVDDGNDLALAFIIQGGVTLIAAVISLFYCFHHEMVYVVRIKISDVVLELKDGWSIFVSTSFASLYTTTIPIILGYTSGIASVGFFSAADKIRLAVQSIINPVSQSLYPRLSRLMVNDKNEARDLLLKVFKFFVLPLFILSFALMCASDYVIYYLYGDELKDAGDLLKVLIWIPPVIAIGNLLGVQVMLPKGMKRQFSKTYVVAAFVGLPLLVINSYYFSVIGACYTSVFIEVFVVCSFWFYIREDSQSSVKHTGSI